MVNIMTLEDLYFLTGDMEVKLTTNTPSGTLQSLIKLSKVPLCLIKRNIGRITVEKKTNIISVHTLNSISPIAKKGCISFGELSVVLIDTNIVVLDTNNKALYIGKNKPKSSSVADMRLVHGIEMVHSSLVIRLEEKLK